MEGGRGEIVRWGDGGTRRRGEIKTFVEAMNDLYLCHCEARRAVAMSESAVPVRAVIFNPEYAACPPSCPP